MNSKITDNLELPLHKQLGIESIQSESGQASFSITLNEHGLNPRGSLHGGIVYLLCDVCAYSALVSVLDQDKDGVTHDIHVSVMRPASLGDFLEVKAKVQRLGRRLAFIDSEVFVREKMIASARVTKSII